jgi:hypothetical protein
VFSTYVYPTVCFGTHRNVLCFGMHCMGGELIYSFAQFFSNLQYTLTPAVWAVCGAVGQGCNEIQEFKKESLLPFALIS